MKTSEYDLFILTVSSLILGLVIGFAFGLLVTIDKGYEDCQEDEVYAWFGDFPDDVVWRCIPFDDLLEQENESK